MTVVARDHFRNRARNAVEQLHRMSQRGHDEEAPTATEFEKVSAFCVERMQRDH